jgi:hypothetical protein
MKIQSKSSAGASSIEWRKSSLCGTDTCVEVAISASKALVRNSKDTARGYLVFDAAEWREFLEGVRNHEFDID